MGPGHGSGARCEPERAGLAARAGRLLQEAPPSPPPAPRALTVADAGMVVAYLTGLGAYLEDDARILPCEADKIDQAAIRRVIALIQRHHLRMDV